MTDTAKFLVTDIFDVIKRGKRIKSADRVDGTLPFITAGVGEMGLSSFIGNAKAEVFPANSLTIDMFGTTYYRGYEYGADDHVTVLFDSNNKIDRGALQYIQPAIENQIKGKYSYSRNFYPSDVDGIEIELPITEDGKPDWYYMSEYVSRIEAEYVSHIEAYLTVIGYPSLESAKLTDYDKAILKQNLSAEMAPYKLIDIFDWQKNIEFSPLKLKNYTDDTEQNEYPFVGQSTTNHGYISYHHLKPELLNNKEGKPTLLIHSNNQNIAYMDTPFYLKDGHGATSILQSINLTKHVAEYLQTVIAKVISIRFSYNDKATKSGLKDTVINLPTIDGNPDYQLMTEYSKVMEKMNVLKLRTQMDEQLKSYSQLINR